MSEPLIELTDEVEKPDINTGFSAHDRQLTVPEEVIVYLNQLNAANMMVNARIEEHSNASYTRFIDGKFCTVDYPKSEADEPAMRLIMSADWHLIGEFRINGFDEEKMPNDIEFVWGWAIRPDDSHTQAVIKVAEDLPYGMQPLTFPVVKFEDIGIMEIIKAFAFNTLNLEYIVQKYSNELRSYGIFGLYNIEWANIPKAIAPEWTNILNVVRDLVQTKFSGMEKKEAIAEAWKSDEVLTLVADYRRKKDAAYVEKQEFVNKFKQALTNPSAVFNDTPEVPAPTPDPLNYALASVERALNAVEEDDLAKLESIGDDLDNIDEP